MIGGELNLIPQESGEKISPISPYPAIMSSPTKHIHDRGDPNATASYQIR